jgi:hypothetical protein
VTRVQPKHVRLQLDPDRTTICATKCCVAMAGDVSPAALAVDPMCGNVVWTRVPLQTLCILQRGGSSMTYS